MVLSALLIGFGIVVVFKSVYDGFQALTGSLSDGSWFKRFGNAAVGLTSGGIIFLIGLIIAVKQFVQ